MSSPRRTFTKSVVISRTEVSIRLAKERKRKREKAEEGVIYIPEKRPGLLGLLGFTKPRQSLASLWRKIVND